MYILRMINKNVRTNNQFTNEDEFSVFIDGVLHTLDITDNKYTIRQEINHIEWKLTVIIEII